MRSKANSWKPPIWSISLSQIWMKSRKIISSAGDNDTPACQISDHSFQAFSLDCQKPQFHSFLATRGPKFNQIWMLHWHAKFMAIPSMCSPQHARNPDFTKFLVIMGPNVANIDQNRFISRGGRETSVCHICGKYFHAFFLACQFH